MSRVERGIVETSDEPVLLQHLLTSIIAGSSARVGAARSISLHLARSCRRFAATPRTSSRSCATC